MSHTFLSETITPAKSPEKKLDTISMGVSTRSNDVTLIETEDISDDEIVIDRNYLEPKKPIEALVNDNSIDTYIPITKTLNSFPNMIDDLRDIRFIAYNDEDNLCLHLKTCLSLDRETSPPLQPYVNVDTNCLNKIFRLGFFKSLLSREKSKIYFDTRVNSLPLSVISSSTAISFKTDWKVNRRTSSSKSRTTPNNIFHILQLNPKTRYSETKFSTPTERKEDISRLKEQFEHLKTILARTYCPELYFTVENEDVFGSRRRLAATTDLVGDKKSPIEIKEMPVSPENPQSSILNLPENPNKEPRMSIHFERDWSEETTDVPEITIRDSIVLLSPAPLPIDTIDSIPEEENEESNKVARKRKFSKSSNSPVNKKHKSSTQPASNTVFSIIEDATNAER